MAKQNIKPLADNILIEPSDQETTLPSGIVIPDSAKEKPQEGKVIAVGPGRVTDSGGIVKMNVKEGDTVFRTIKKIKKLYDVAPVTFPAYESTSVQARKIDELKNQELKEENSNTDAIRNRELYLLKLNRN